MENQVLNKINFKIGGEAGMGIMTLGNMFGKMLKMHGLNVVTVNDFPSLIRGGHNTNYIRGDSEPIYSAIKQIDVLVGLNKEAALRHYNELSKGGALIYDESKVKLAEGEIKRGDIRVFPIQLSAIALKVGGEIFFNTVALGAACALVSIEFAVIEDAMKQTWGRKGPEIVQKNINAAKEGYQAIKSVLKEQFKIKIAKVGPDNQILLTGNDAACIGAVKAGVKLVAEYPMSPSSSVLHFMAAHEFSHSIVVKHTEDEIAAMNMIAGAGAAGVRALTATSGGGFSLMAEALGLAGLSEIPCVIINVQRAGPSTGLPTYGEQADLKFALCASQGEFPRLVCAPGDVEEAFYETFKMFNLTDLVQTPGIVLLDKELSDGYQSTRKFDTSKLKVERGKLLSDAQLDGKADYKRFEITEDGISPRPLMGQKNGLFVATSYEHDETSFTTEEPKLRVGMIDKRWRKIKNIKSSDIVPKYYGDANPDLLIVGWGSTKSPILESLKFAKKAGMKVGYLHIVWMYPFASNEILAALKTAKKVVGIEMNSTGQLRDLVRERTGFYIPDSQMYLKYDARPFYPEDIFEFVKNQIERK
ncbi:2-oxoacid:acceptor oxidoreductase subunit alpha [Candidatus Parvarchaeota archaeon]|nr:2-oxoacid:acceptor oxidoreductase subunit alpha [Candidatus Parvarchaeota archaeon]